MAAVKKLFLLRDVEDYDYSTGDHVEALAEPRDNEKMVEAFLKEAITAAGFSPRKKPENDTFSLVTRVFIKDLGGKFFLECCNDYSEAGADGVEDKIEIKSFFLGCDDYWCDLDTGMVEYKKFEEIVEKHLVGGQPGRSERV